MRIGVIGINHKLGDLKLREKLAIACLNRFGPTQSFQTDHHFVLLSTCNRTEVYFSSDDLAVTHSYLLSILRLDVEEEFDHKLYSYFGVDCFSHLAKVTSGLDSAIIAETEIQGQVKLAYEGAMEYRNLPKELHFLFQKALGIAKNIRSEYQLGRGMPDLEHAVLQIGCHFFKAPEETRILFVGASDINQKILGFFKGKDLGQITLCNRSDGHGKAIAQKQGIESLEWRRLKEWADFDWIIFGTKSPDYLIARHDLTNQMVGQKLVMDLCVPRNVDPRLGLDPRITLLNIDQINRQLKIRHRGLVEALAEAESKIAHATHNHVMRYANREQNRLQLTA